MESTPPNPYPISPEEQLEAHEVVTLLRAVYLNAAEDDADRRNHRNTVLARDVQLELQPYVQFCVPREDDPRAPMATPYEQLFLRPEPGSVLRRKVTAILAQFPAVPSDEAPFELPEGGADYWRDVSLEVRYKDGTTNHYWLSSKGLTPYVGADAIDYDYDRSSRSDHMFTVIPGQEDLSARPLSSSELRVWLRQSVVQPQSNTLEDE